MGVRGRIPNIWQEQEALDFARSPLFSFSLPRPQGPQTLAERDTGRLSLVVLRNGGHQISPGQRPASPSVNPAPPSSQSGGDRTVGPRSGPAHHLPLPPHPWVAGRGDEEVGTNWAPSSNPQGPCCARS